MALGKTGKAPFITSKRKKGFNGRARYEAGRINTENQHETIYKREIGEN